MQPSDKNSTRPRCSLIKALKDNKIDIITTDHAPHTLEEKQVEYDKAPAGLPLVEHALLSLLEHVSQGRLSLTDVVSKTAHNPALRYAIKDRGFIREGYYADLLLVDTQLSTTVTNKNCLYYCGWTPFAGQKFSSRITDVWINGHHGLCNGEIQTNINMAQALVFKR